MKTVLFSAILSLALVGCSGGSKSQDPAQVPPVQNGSIVLSLHQGSLANPNSSVEASVTNHVEAAVNTPPATDIRFIVTNPTTGFSSIQDIVIASTTTINIPVPAANGYVLSAISSAAGFNYTHYMLKFGEVTGINIVANQNTTVTMVLQPMVGSLTVPTQAGGGDAFTMSITAPKPTYLYGYMNTSTSPFVGITVNANNPPMFNSGSLALNALTARDSNGLAIEGTMYFQAVYYLSPTYCTGGDEWSKWVYVYPDPYKGDANVTTHLKIPTGGLGVDLTY